MRRAPSKGPLDPHAPPARRRGAARHAGAPWLSGKAGWPAAAGAAALVLGVAVILPRLPSPDLTRAGAEEPAPPSASSDLSRPDASAGARPLVPAPPLVLAKPEPAPEAAQPPTEEDRLESIQALRQAALEGESEALERTLEALHDPDPEVRDAARAAAFDLGDRAAAPHLREAAAAAHHPLERQSLLEAAEYLELPTLTEHLEQRRARDR